MLIPVQQLYPARLNPSEERTTAVETNLPVAPLLRPRIFFRNASDSYTVRVTITHVLELGFTDDPLVTGTYETVIMQEDLAPGELLCHVFMTAALQQNGMTFHQFTLENLSPVGEVIFHTWIEGEFEETLKNVPTFEPIVI
jgi:hypothetical protein